MRFLHPEIAWWFVALFALTLAIRAAARRRLGVGSNVPWVFEAAYRASLMRRLPIGAFVIGLVLLACASMDPVLPLAETRMESHGLDIVIALDLSSSMEQQMDRPHTR